MKQSSPTRFVCMAVALVALLNAAAILHQLWLPYPLNPWESGLIVDASRASQGIPVYADAQTDHATWMYGPSSIFAVSVAFRLFGPTLYAGRMLSFAAAATLLALLARCFTAGQSTGNFWFALGVLLTTHIPSCSYLTDPRPELTSALCGFLFLVAYYRAFHAGDRWLVVPGLACLLAAITFKQTTMAFSVVPAIAMLLHSRPGFRAAWPALVAPLALSAATVAMIRLIWPTMYGYMFRLPSTFPLDFVPGKLSTLFVLYTPLFVIMLVDWWRAPKREGQAPQLMLWALTCGAVTGGASLFIASKRGGNFNAFLLPWLSMIAFCSAGLPRARSWLSHPHPGRPRWFFAVLCAGLILATLAVNFPANLATAWGLHHGDRHYRAVIREVRQLPGVTVCPEDPTIALFASDRFGRCLTLEIDAASWSPRMPAYVARELQDADWVIRVNSAWSRILNDLWLDHGALRDLGYGPVESASSSDSVYTVWRNDLKPTPLGRPTNSLGAQPPASAPGVSAANLACLSEPNENAP